MDLVIEKSQPKTGTAMMILLNVKLGNFTFRYFQFREIVPAILAATTPAQHVLIASISELPGSDIPLVGKVVQEFDQALFV
jgi:hypothetical protein